MLLLLLLVLGVSLVFTQHHVLRLTIIAGLSLIVGVYVAGLFGAVNLLLGLAMVGWGLLRPDEQPWTRAAVWRQARADTADLSTITGFAETLAALQTRCALTAYRQGQEMVGELERTLARMAANGTMTAAVRGELIALTRQHLARINALTDSMQAALVRLAMTYDPRSAPRLWLRRTDRPWWRELA